MMAAEGEAFEIVGQPGPSTRLVLTAEHASAAVPPPLTTTAADATWLTTHWALDIGIADVTRRLVERLDAVAVLARFSRLVIDANRAIGDRDSIRAEVEGYALSFNRGLDDTERARRAATLHAPYHDAIDSQVAAAVAVAVEPVLLLSMHSFTPIFGVDARWMQVGVLFDEHDPLAELLADAIADAGFAVARNEPYSGKAGLIYAAQRHGHRHGVVHLELELRQDEIATPQAAAAVADRLVTPLQRLLAQLGRETARRAQP